MVKGSKELKMKDLFREGDETQNSPGKVERTLAKHEISEAKKPEDLKMIEEEEAEAEKEVVYYETALPGE